MAFIDEMHLRLTQLATRDADDEPGIGSLIFVPAAGGGWDELVVSVPAAGLQNIVGINNAETAPSYKVHYDNTNPSTSAVGDAAAPGTQVISARRDHVHGREAFGSDPAQIDIGDALGGGSAITVARSDHQHAFPAPAAGYPQDVTATEADGTATTPARSDHAHAHASIATGDLHPEYMTPAEHTAVGNSAPHHAAITMSGTPDYITLSGQDIVRGLIDLTADVTGDLPSANLFPASGASVLLGRGSAAGAGDWQEITLGSNLSMSGTTLSAADAAPTNADYLVGTAHAGLSAEIVVGTTPGGELGGTWASPTVDSVHSGSAHHAAVTLAASADVLLGLSTQELSLDTQSANLVLAGPASGAAAAPTFRQVKPLAIIAVGCHAQRESGTQTISNATDTDISLDGEQTDTDTFHDNSTNPDRITIPTGMGGLYLVGGYATFAANATGYRKVAVTVNNFDIASTFLPGNSVAVNTISAPTRPRSLNAGDIVRLRVHQTSGGDLNVQNGADQTALFVLFMGT